jgi:hypothetical protein
MPIFVVDLLKGFGLGIEGKHNCHFVDLLKGFGLEIDRGFNVFYNRRYFLNFRRYLKN